MKYLKLYERFAIILTQSTDNSLDAITQNKYELPDNLFLLTDEEIIEKYGNITQIAVDLSPEYIVNFLVKYMDEMNPTFKNGQANFSIQNRKYLITMIFRGNNNSFRIFKDNDEIGYINYEEDKNKDYVKILDIMFEMSPEYFEEFFKTNLDDISKSRKRTRDIVKYYKKSYLYQKYLINKGEIRTLMSLEINPQILEEHPEIKDFRKQVDWS